MGMTMQKLIKVTSFQAKRLARDESAATAIEYAIIASGIAVAIVTAVSALGTATSGMFGTVEAGVK